MAINFQNKFYIRISTLVFDKENKYLMLLLKAYDLETMNFLFERKIEFNSNLPVREGTDLVFKDNKFYELKTIKVPKKDENGNIMYDQNGGTVMEEVLAEIPINDIAVYYNGKYYKNIEGKEVYEEYNGWDTTHFFDKMYKELETTYKFNIYKFLYERIIPEFFQGDMI